MKYQNALKEIANAFAGMTYTDLSTFEKSILRKATVALSWTVCTDSDGCVVFQVPTLDRS